MNTRISWFQRLARRNRPTAAPATTSVQGAPLSGILSNAALERAFERERARVERNHQCFSLVIFSVEKKAAKDMGLAQAIGTVAGVLQSRIRTYDDVGLIAKDQLGVLLPETTGTASWVFADGAIEAIEAAGVQVSCEVYTYPHPGIAASPSEENLQMGQVDPPQADDSPEQKSESLSKDDVAADHESSERPGAFAPHVAATRSRAPRARAAFGETGGGTAVMERPVRLRAVPRDRALASATFVDSGYITAGGNTSSAFQLSTEALSADLERSLSEQDAAHGPIERPSWRMRVMEDAATETRPIQDMAPYFEERLPLYRRAIDVAVAGTALLAVSPVLISAAILVKTTSRGSIIFAQDRAGRGGRPFRFYKLRSMYQDAEAKKKELQGVNEKDGPIFKIKDDPRITPVGKILRKFSIDELPQLFNVLKGDMTLVGPRPPVLGEVDEYETWQRQRLDITGGITCIWQVSGRSEVTFREWMRMDVRYRKKRSIAMDAKLIWKTFGAVFSGKGAY